MIQIPWQAGTEVVAMYKFPGNSPEDLSFRKGDVLTIVHSCAVREKDFMYIVVLYTVSENNGTQIHF